VRVVLAEGVEQADGVGGDVRQRVLLGWPTFE
jgi:hypothetical protein